MENEEQVDRRYTRRDYMEKSGRSRLPWDHEITDPQIMVIDNSAMEGPLSTRFVLTKLAPEESLRMIDPYVPADPKEGTPVKYAVCKIVNKEDEYKAEKERKEKKKKTAKPKTKEVEVSWGISENDLLTKMRQLGAFFEKGLKAEIVLGSKKRAKKVSEADAQELLNKVKEEVEARGGRETNPPTGVLGAVMRLSVESKVKK